MSGLYRDRAGSGVDRHILHPGVSSGDDDALGGAWSCDIGKPVGVRGFVLDGDRGELAVQKAFSY